MKFLDAIYELSKILSSETDIYDSIKKSLFTLSEWTELKNLKVKFFSDAKILSISPEGEDEEREKIEKRVRPGMSDVFDIQNGRLYVVPIRIENRDIGFISTISDGSDKVDETLKLLSIISTLIGYAYIMYPKTTFKFEKVENIVFSSKKMKEIINLALKVSKTDASVLLRGESGVGKELLADLIHKHSKRKKKPFIKVNCAAIPETLLEAELFGYTKGAFTGAITERKGRFEEAHGGTIFLDEIGDMPKSLQAKILRVIQSREFERLGSSKVVKADVRIIAATNKNLEELVKRGEFREDLYFRLNVVPIFIPPLRERKEDIPPLVEHFLLKYNSKYSKNISISKSALALIENYDWPGNVREIENMIERLVVTTSDLTITLVDIPLPIKFKGAQKDEIMSITTKLPEIIRDIETSAIRDVLKRTRNISEAARILGVTRRQLEWKLRKYNF